MFHKRKKVMRDPLGLILAQVFRRRPDPGRAWAPTANFRETPLASFSLPHVLARRPVPGRSGTRLPRRLLSPHLTMFARTIFLRLATRVSLPARPCRPPTAFCSSSRALLLSRARSGRMRQCLRDAARVPCLDSVEGWVSAQAHGQWWPDARSWLCLRHRNTSRLSY